jgi:hypothetical protein
LGCRGYWAHAVILLLSQSPSGGCSGLLLQPDKPRKVPFHQPRKGKVIIYPDGSTTFTEWAEDSDEDESDEEDDVKGLLVIHPCLGAP